jgi:hypothetical protein
VIVNGVTVVPANTNAVLRVTDVKNPKLKRASLANARPAGGDASDPTSDSASALTTNGSAAS